MRIGINLLYLIPGVVGGTEVYGRSLLKALGESPQGHTFFVYTNLESRHLDLPAGEAIHIVHCPVAARFRFLRYLWEQLILPWQLFVQRVKIVHSLGYVSPLVTKCLRVTTVHDVVFLERARDLPFIKRWALRWFCMASVRRSDAIIVPSQASKEQLIRLMPSSGHKVHVIYEAADDELATTTPELWLNLKDRLQIDWPYLLAAGIDSVHKNILRVVMAFEQVMETVPHHLVLTGYPQRELLDHIATLDTAARTRIHLVGYLKRDEFASILVNASALIHASLYEGFGIPVLEAQRIGVPVVCSNVFSLPEIAGDAAVLFDPTSVTDMIRAIKEILTDAALATVLRVRGFQNVQHFSWRTAGKQSIDLYEMLSLPNTIPTRS